MTDGQDFVAGEHKNATEDQMGVFVHKTVDKVVNILITSLIKC
jgi:hypothetical protein